MTFFGKRMLRRRSRAAAAPEPVAAVSGTEPATSAELTAPSIVPVIARANRFSVQDLLIEASYGVGARPSRLVMTTLGTVLGIASLVVTIGFAQTAAGQISNQFDAVSATQIMIEPASTRNSSGNEQATGRLPWDSPERVDRLAGVKRAGLVADVDVAGALITSVPVNDPSAAQTLSPAVIATSPGLLAAVRGDVVTGRYFDAGHDERGDRVAVLGARAAETLGINRVDSQPSIFIGEVPYTVIGIIDGVERRANLLDAVIVPLNTARTEFALAAPAELHVQINVGAGTLVARQAPIALDPGAPENFKVQAPAAASSLQDNIQADINIVFLTLGILALLAGGLGIANVTLLSVMERVGEIGLRRALGATKRDIARQFIVESAVIGLLGGLIGSALGVFAVVVVSLLQGWTPILDPFVAIGAALLGTVVGLAAGAYPAVRASNIEPITALRGGT
ncbi:ABC transporter permease [Cryobacterium sp. PH31-O1]|uniref:ABC transporter permease n=1 Tax=Cryobacterium sp. PH31-O1 TaxID=3046306 RepID=UPI0024BB09B0|nr:ABC transporter permease [Cryobacterium sp. PH31-O1]MDJ0338523.1 ABC transporter permease [Cryobacterium sp. PH31-O1]